MWLLGRLSVRRKFQILGLCLLSIAAFIALGLYTRDARDRTVEFLGSSAVRNQGGVLGAFIAAGLVAALGFVGAWAVPIALLAWGWNRLRLRRPLELGIRTGLGALGLVSLLGFLYLVTSGNRPISGGIGEWIGFAAARLLGRVGGELALGTALVVLGVIAFEIGSSSPVRNAVQAVLSFLFAPFLSKEGHPEPKEAQVELPADVAAGPPTRRMRKPLAVEEEEIASAWDSREEKPRKQSRPRIIAR